MIRKLLLSFLFFLLSFFTFGKNTSDLNITTIRANYISYKTFVVAGTITSTNTGGSWSSPSSWVGGVVPSATDDVVIASGATITISGSTNDAKTLTINGNLLVSNTVTLNSVTQVTINGLLSFADNNSNIHLPANTGIKINSPGKVDDTNCSNNVAIYIGSTKFVACTGNGGQPIYKSFTDLNNSGGTINAIASSNSPVCLNGTINLSGSYSGTVGNTTSTGSTPGVNYSWSVLAPDGTTITTSTAQNYSLTASQAGNYTATLTCTTYYGSNPSTSTSTITVAVVNQPFSITSVTVPAAQCLSTATVTIQATPARLPVGNYTVIYSRNDPWATNLNASMTVTTAGTGTFTATGLTNAGNASTTITVNNLASGSCSNAITANNVSNTFVMRAALSAPTLDGAGFASCSNYVVQILNQSPNATNYYLDVSTSNTFATYLSGYQNKDLGTTFQHTITGLTPGTQYYYRFRSANICGTTANSATGSFTAPAATGGPTPTFITPPSGSVCANTSVTYTTQSGNSNYQWTVPGNAGDDYTITAGGIGTSNNSVTLTWLTSGSKTVTVNYSSNGCLGSTQATNTITVNSNLTAGVTVTHDQASTTICQGTNVRFTATPINGGTAPTYKWYNGTTLLTETSNSYLAYNLLSTDDIRVEMTSNVTSCLTGNPVKSSQITFTVITTDRGRTHGGGNICYGSVPPKLTLTNFDGPANTPYSDPNKIVRWEYSTDGNNTWRPISGTDKIIEYTPTAPLYVNTTFRAVAQTGSLQRTKSH
ncbi:beta strand repeat-containing protein [Flavobacterium sp. P21]|uniref:beta strand repeat-containing protein n=1 Tax=Flavobacterium sp. P21 TaxID=3423948 RepID=UPI003D6769DF